MSREQPSFCFFGGRWGVSSHLGLWVAPCVLQTARLGAEPVNPAGQATPGLEEGARGWWDVSLEELLCCFLHKNEQRVLLPSSDRVAGLQQ